MSLACGLKALIACTGNDTKPKVSWPRQLARCLDWRLVVFLVVMGSVSCHLRFARCSWDIRGAGSVPRLAIKFQVSGFKLSARVLAGEFELGAAACYYRSREPVTEIASVRIGRLFVLAAAFGLSVRALSIKGSHRVRSQEAIE